MCDPADTACVDGCGESFELERGLELTFDTDDPTADGSANPDWGVDRVAGDYFESVTGLHRLSLEVAGTFTLRRVSRRGALNQ